jgi:hypothetical protein
MAALAEAIGSLFIILIDGAKNRDVRVLHDNALPGDQDGRVAQWANVAGSRQSAKRSWARQPYCSSQHLDAALQEFRVG